jgi:hypothetical protein
MDAVRADLMASAVGKIGGVTWHHLFLVAADASGKQSYLRAGPQCLPLERLAGRKAQYGDAIEEYEPSPAGPYGVITISSDVYEPGGVDFDPVAANVTLASGNAAAQLWGKVQKAAKALEEEQIPYDPIGKGANWAIMEALRRCGVEVQLPPKRWAPGAFALAPAPMAQGVSTRRLGQAVVEA